MRGFTWRAKQRHRPKLEVMASTGRKHGFESLEELRLLVALDFLRASEVLSQPFLLTRPDAIRHYGDLRKVLTEYATQLARIIENGKPVTSQ